MFDMENIQKMMGQAQQMQADMKEQLSKMAIRATAGGDSVEVVVNGHKEVTKIEISEAAAKNPALLSDLILSALSSAYIQVDQQTANQMPASLSSMMQNVDMSALMDMFKK